MRYTGSRSAGHASNTMSPPSTRAATTDPAPTPESTDWPLMIAIVLTAPPRICTGSMFKPFLAKRPASLPTQTGRCEMEVETP